MPCRNPPELLDPAKEALDQVTVLVLFRIKFPLLLAVAFQGDDCLCPGFFKLGQQAVGIVSLVRQHRFRRKPIQQPDGLGNVMHLPAGQAPTGELPQPLDHRMGFGARPATRTPKGLFSLFWGAPAACWWARTIVLSMKAPSKSASLHNSASTRRHTSASGQRANRLWTLFQGTHPSGKSRHGDPVLATHSTAPTNSRLSAAVQPRSLLLPESMPSTRPHWSSRSIFLSIFQPIQLVGIIVSY